MEAFAEAYIGRLHELVKGFEAALTGLPAEALDWTPGPEMNSLAVLATHAAAATRYLIGDVIAGEPSGRVRPEEFLTQGVAVDVLRQRLQEAAMHSEQVVARLTAADLGTKHFSPQHDADLTTALCLFRSLDHLAEHMAHAQLTRMLWEANPTHTPRI